VESAKLKHPITAEDVNSVRL